MSRAFDAPRAMVYEALTKPELVERWHIGPDGWSMVVCEMDFRPGGAYRYVWKHQDGTTMAMAGVYREIVPPSRLVKTEKFDESWYPGEAIVSTDLVEQNGKTTLTMVIAYESREARDTALQSPMETGVAAELDRLQAVLSQARP